MDIQREAQGPRHSMTGRTLARLGSLSMKQSDPVTAEIQLREAREILREALPPDHREQARPTLWLGWVLVHTERSEEAEVLLREALAIRRDSFPTGSVFIAEAELALAACLARQGQLDESRELFAGSAPALSDSIRVPAT